MQAAVAAAEGAAGHGQRVVRLAHGGGQPEIRALGRLHPRAQVPPPQEPSQRSTMRTCNVYCGCIRISRWQYVFPIGWSATIQTLIGIQYVLVKAATSSADSALFP